MNILVRLIYIPPAHQLSMKHILATPDSLSINGKRIGFEQLITYEVGRYNPRLTHLGAKWPDIFYLEEANHLGHRKGLQFDEKCTFYGFCENANDAEVFYFRKENEERSSNLPFIPLREVIAEIPPYMKYLILRPTDTDAFNLLKMKKKINAIDPPELTSVEVYSRAQRNASVVGLEIAMTGEYNIEIKY